MFRGVNTLKLDSKGRMTVPTRYRKSLQESCSSQLVITIEAVDRNQSLLLYPLPEWEQIESKLTSLPALDRHARRLQRLLIGHATECEMDAQGRILLPAELREYAGIDKNVVMCGLGNKFELWDEQSWLTQRQGWLEEDGEDEEKAPPLSAQLANLSL